MKKNTANFNEVLRTLAIEGDASAFFSLTEPYFQSYYQKERNSGTTHQDAKNKIVAEAKALFQQLYHLPLKHFDAWFQENCTLPPSAQNDQEEVLLDKKIVVETSRFLNECGQELIRTGSLLKNKRRLKDRQFPVLLLKNRFFVPACILSGFLVLCCASVFYMIKMQISCTVALSSPKNTYVLQIPPQSLITDPALPADTAHQPDSIAVKTSDTMKTLNETAAAPVEKPVTPQQTTALPRKSYTQPSPAVERRYTPPAVSRPQAATYPSTVQPVSQPATPITAAAPVSAVPAVTASPAPAENEVPSSPVPATSGSEQENGSY